MFVVIVNAHVRPECIETFIAATLDNVSNSIKEPGISRFDFYQQIDDPSRFTLVEIYRSEDAPTKHRETAHYMRWSTTVANLMLEPRSKVTYKILHSTISE